MWTVFYNEKKTIISSIQEIEDIKNIIFKEIECEVKKYYAKKIITYFDHNMIFNQHNGGHNNLLDSLSKTQKEMYKSSFIFPRIEGYLYEDNGLVLMINKLNEKYDIYLKNKNYTLFKKNLMINEDNLIKLENKSWKTLIFDIELVNYVNDWLDYAPSFEERCAIQAENIIFEKINKNLEIKNIDFCVHLEELKTQPQYQDLIKKMYKIIPKIQTKLEHEWRNSISEVEKKQLFKKIKK